jgi:hypothetical protein
MTAIKTAMTIQEVAARFNELAQQKSGLKSTMSFLQIM